LSSSDDHSNTDLKRRLQGQLNRLSEKNLSSILTEIESFYRSQSRASMNSCLYQLYSDSLLSSLSLSNESLLSEHALLTCLLHTNIGIEIGSFILENILQKFVEHINDDVSNKINDNLIIFVSYLYSFYMTNGKILFDIARYLLNFDQLNEKRLELILLLLKTIGFVLRKDNPLELKSFLQELRTACSTSTLLSSSSKRIEFMMDTITSLKNNDVRKLPGGFEPERIDRLRKLYRTLVKDKTVQQANMLNVGLQEFLNAKEEGRWWIVGSAWQKPVSQDKKDKKNDQQFNDTITKLAKQQHMNTDVRRLIFGTLLTSEVIQHFKYTSFIKLCFFYEMAKVLRFS
jgi:nucleolar MIF4G domain-containing protein 1